MKAKQAGPSLATLVWRRRCTLTALFLCLVLVVAGCSASPTDFGSPELDVRTGDTGLKITNKLGTSVYYFAVERERAALINWTAVSRPENEIAPGQTRVVSYSDIGGFAKGKQILLFYWATPDPASGDIQPMVISTDG